MCYSFKPVKTLEGLRWLPEKVFRKLQAEGRISGEPEWIFPGDRPYVYTWIDGEIQDCAMRFDLVPRFYLKKENLPLEDMLKRKRSKKQGGDGFDSYNARSESILAKASFRAPWAESKRLVVPASAFRERPNMEGAPKEFKGREYMVHLGAPKYLAGIWDRWENQQGEVLESFSILTVDSLGNPLLRGIWHERCPLILEDAQVEEWLDPKTRPERALDMIRLYPGEGMSLEEVIPVQKPKAAKQMDLFE
jgi:putative SOS response-associated peptidase YedK